MAVVGLEGLSTLFSHPSCKNEDIANEASALSKEIKQAIEKVAVITKGENKIFAYEVDGYGAHYIMDDANIPSLLTLPFYGFVDNNDPVYLATRELVWSKNQPWFFTGSKASGIGSPHTGENKIWPMGLVSYAMTSNSDEEIKMVLETLVRI